MIEDGRALSLVLDAPEYDLFRLSVDLGEGAKTGMLTLILPVQPKISQAAEGREAQADASDGFKGNALDAPVTMDAVVARITMPLNEICQLAQGSILPVPTECLSKTELVAAGNHVVSEVLLGQMNGLRAVRFAPSEGARAEGVQISEPEGRGAMAEGSAVSGGETLEGHAVEVDSADSGADNGAKNTAGDGGGHDAQNLTAAAAEILAPDTRPPSVDLSELDTLPEEV
jgi:flagellar motor switch protein FliM